ncbi:glycosyltransferase [Alkalicoccobacillus porphyridii]|uniref:Glycosyltransferase n=1 Tax=Alkalicoccobacillus porphyridii TaxID=2597270 RepID=A0A554A4E8_9BACI|nr:glycosyltransferase [Alkalicoccobacillus porphyridii]TSB48569.1 glycosyltransferase [Alkalicoccobacillus porphyridii]
MIFIKILHVINRLSPGGAQRLLIDTVRLMNQKNNIETDILLLSDEKNIFKDEIIKTGINVKSIKLQSVYNPLNSLYIRNFIKEGDYDLVHVHLFPSNYWVSLASKSLLKSKTKFLTTEHSTHNKRRDKLYLRHLEKFIYRSYSKVISISDHTQKNLISWLKPKREDYNKFAVVHNGVDVKKFKVAKPYYKREIINHFTEETKLLCMVGSFSPQKDQETLIKAMIQLPREVHLLLIGDGKKKVEQEQLAKNLKVDERVHFLGVRNDVDRVFKTVDIILVSSNWEGFGLVAAEGMAAGKPVIASDVPGLNEVVQDAGLFFNKGDTQELTYNINNLLNNHKLYHDVLERCSQKAEMFSIELLVEKYLKEYKSIIS